MYNPSYNPTTDDLYIYGPGNSGPPIGLNTNCTLYPYREFYKSISIRNRSYDNLITPVPPGTPDSLLPNYYNTSNPLFSIHSPTIVAASVHYISNLASDSIDGKTFTKYTGTTSASPINEIKFWNSNFTGTCGYGPWLSAYNCVPENQITGGTAFLIPKYFSGSPEIPGFESGATFYQILSKDHALMELNPLAPFNMPQRKMEILDIFSLITEEQRNNIFDYFQEKDVFLNSKTYLFFFPIIDCYLWDGNDKLVPLEYLSITLTMSSNSSISNTSASQASFFTPEGSKTSTGDSSSKMLCLRGETLYFLGHILGGVAGPAYGLGTMPFHNFLQGKNIDKNHYTSTLNQGLTLATKIDFERIKTASQSLITSLTNLYNRVS